ncbi:polysaccharide pyruvyl transferase [Megasphaera cerevisiae DSM 20462]|uniref:Polysaccharide pyruvyl transferase n=4 Tax=Bacillota TaxID=1239 RepID=A0A0J6ZPG5_9FIRM|nr:polysaccharide pyruvyl transferase CsaB [Megasphaera cerevisiae]KMO86786.1 polysaccharide pyruvyl transferase [Megasphaera cerevisiae DSM 20462]SJZ35356.1 polysaccharide pyruvyl transferase CsaB [Megasphaera cerevisiae DSM 20462]
MIKIVISGYYGFANAGDEAMLSAITSSLQDMIPGAEITVITGNCSMTSANHNVKTVYRMNFLGIAAAICRCDILISGGGSLLQNVTSSRSLYYYLYIIRTALFFHKPVMLYAQGIGPVRGRKAREAVKRILQRVDVIGVRDADSQKELAAIGVTKPHIQITADAVLAMHPVDTNTGLYILKKAGVDGIRRRIGIAVRNWQNMTAYKDEIAKAADALQRRFDAHIIFIPMQYPADVEAGADIASRMKTRAIVLREPYNTVEFMSLMGCMDAVIANRLHALIFASIMQVPVAAVSYDPKIDSFIQLIGEKVCGTVDTIQADALIDAVSQKLQAGQIAPEVKARLNHLRRQSLHNACLALRVLEGKKNFRSDMEKDTRI